MTPPSVALTARHAEAAPTCTLAPFALVRVAALPFEVLIDLRPPRLAGLCAELAAARAVQARLRPGLERALHAAVPGAADVRARRTLIDLKRAVHGGRPCKRPQHDITAARSALTLDEATELDAWLAAQAAIEAAFAAAEQAFADDVRDHVRPHLRGLAIAPGLERPLSLASPELWRRLRQEAGRAAPSTASSKAERSLLGYLVRAAAKANPFSTFAWIGSVDLHRRGVAAPTVDGIPRWVRSVLSRSTVDRLERAAFAATAGCDVKLRRNAGFRLLDEQRVEALVAVSSPRDGRSWRQPVRRIFRTPAAIADALAKLPDEVTVQGIVDALCATGLVGATDAVALSARFLDTGLFEQVASADAFTASADEAVAAGLASRSATIAETLGAMSASAQAVAQAEPSERVTLVERVRALEERSLGAARASDRSPFRNAVIESAGFSARCGGIGGALAQSIADAGTAVRGLVRLDSTYVALHNRFVERFGAGGVCDDMLGFLHDEADRLAAPGISPPAELPAAGLPAVAGPVPVTLAFQISARDAAAAARGDADVVVNKIYPGVGWLTARHACGDTPAHEALRADMQRWLREAAAPAEPIDVPLCGNVTDLQAHPRLTQRVLEWPPEPLRPGTPGVVRARDLRLRHDPVTDRLTLEDPEGQRVAPISLGSMLLQPAMGAYYLLWRIGTPHAIHSPGAIPPADPTVPVERRPRRTVGRVVVGRESWWISSRWLGERILSRRGADRALAATEELGAIGVPPTFFARPYLSLTSPLLFSSLRKPIWIDSRNPFFLDLLAPVVAATEWTVLTETLPGRDQVWTTLDGRDHVAELHAEMILH